MDGASIYAGASSGSSGVAVNLLACLLARAFSPSEATALWVELVAQRKKQIEDNSDDSQYQSLAATMACRQELSRNELAKWDASARAWLLSADQVKKLESTQFKLIVKELGMFTSSVGDTYASTIDVWITAMRSLQDLINGMPQKITKGALLLGISAWHIYPDLNVIGPTAYVRFKDSLVNPGGIITIGLSASGNDTGAKWSLSLSHLRYYGDPVTVSMPAEADSSRITMEQLHLVALGSVIGSWGMSGTTAQNGAEVFVALKDFFSGQDNIFGADDLLWLNLLWTAAKKFLDTPQGIRGEASHLITYGQRNGQHFLGEEKQPEPIFGLAHPLLLAATSSWDKDEEQSIEDLRHLASQCNLKYDQCIVRYLRKAVQSSDPCKGPTYEYATAIPLLRTSKSRDGEGRERATRFHMRWLQTEDLRSRHLPSDEECYVFDFMKIRSSASPCSDSARCRRDSGHGFDWFAPPRIFCKHSRYNNRSFGKTRESSCTVNEEETDDISEYCTASDDEKTNFVCFELIAGNAKFAALYRVAGTDTHFQEPQHLKDFEVTKVLRSGNLCAQKIKSLITRGETSRDLQSFHSQGHFGNLAKNFMNIKRSLVALARAAEIYDELPEATVSMTVTKRPLHLAKWATPGARHKSHIGGWASRFACVAMFETGTLDIEPSALSSVMAMSSGNSIYVANPLIRDPSEDVFDRYKVTRILGNLGRPGVVMLVPPQAPRIVERDPNSWRLINHHCFNGETFDAFLDTSLHLSFTEYEIPLSVPIGAIDAEAVMLESLISVYDRAKWIADLDVLGNLANQNYCQHILSHPPCEGLHQSRLPKSRGEETTTLTDTATRQLVSIDSWDELLDPPEKLGKGQIGVIRAHNNWQARLATMSVSVQMKYRTVVFPKGKICEDYLRQGLKEWEDFSHIFIL